MQYTYIDIIGKYYPNVEVYISGNDMSYENIQWISTQISKAELDAKLIENAMTEKIIELSKECENVITGGFQSSATGSPKIYDAEQEDQINLIGATSTTAPTPSEPNGYTIYYACRDIATGVKSYILHNHLHLRQVMADGANFKLIQLQKFNTKRVLVAQCTTIEQIEAITWTSIE